MSIRIGNTVYIDGMDPVDVEALPEGRHSYQAPIAYTPTESTLSDLMSMRPGRIVWVKHVDDASWIGG